VCVCARAHVLQFVLCAHTLPSVACTALFADTPGLYSALDYDAQWDAQVASFAFLSSSVVLYNTMRTIDVTAMSQLAQTGLLSETYGGDIVDPRVTTLDDCLSRQGDVDDSFKAALLWVIRDADLELRADGKDISPLQW
jgi:hypothetical protein